jgi:hypothetical protein
MCPVERRILHTDRSLITKAHHLNLKREMSCCYQSISRISPEYYSVASLGDGGSQGTQQSRCLPLSRDVRNRLSFRNVEFSSYTHMEFRTMDKVQKSSNFCSYTPWAASFRFLFSLLGSQPFCWALASFSVVLILYTFGRTPWSGYQAVASPATYT